MTWEQTEEEKEAGYPKRPVAKSGYVDVIKKRTLAHQALDVAVARAYGWADYTPATSDDEILRRLLALNLAASQAQAAAEAKPKKVTPRVKPAPPCQADRHL